VSDTLQVTVKPLDNGWHSFVPIGPSAQISLGPTIAATLRFVDGTSVELEMHTVDGQIPEWYARRVPHHDFKYVGMSNSHRATFFQVGT
jgi:hypothetical protein